MAEDKNGAVPQGGVTPAPSAAQNGGQGGAFDLDAWLKDAPQEALDGLSQRFAHGVNAFLSDEYGDMLPIVLEIKNDPELRKKFTRLAKQEGIDKEELDFLFGTGIDTYEQDIKPKRTVRGGPAAGSDGGSRALDLDDPRDKEIYEMRERLDAIDKRDKDAQLATNQKNYEAYRLNEAQALIKERPDLAFKVADESDPGYKKMAHIAEIAENRTKANYERGIQKVVSYKEVADELDAVLGLEKPKTAPATTTQRLDSKPQAPKTVSESKQRMQEQLASAGGFRKLAEASRRG